MSHRERENKFCTKCQKVKTIYEFNINSNGRYYSWCRSCMSEYGKEYQKKMRAMNSATIQTTLTERNRRLQIHIGQELYYQEMDDCASGYAAYILEQVETAKETCSDPVVMIEQRVDFSRWVEEGFGTADCIIIADGTLQVIDFKYGLGVLVSATENPQMMCYALGALELFDDIYDIDTVRMTIYQPRRDNLSTYELSKDDLNTWADDVLKPAAELAFAGDGNFLCGEWCGFCKAKNACRARADANLELAKYDFKLPPLLTDEDVEDILGKIDDLVSWASDIKEYALAQAISGKQWSGFKLVEGRSNRRYVNDAAVAAAVTEAGFDPYEQKLLGITAMQKMLGKARFDEVLSGLIEKPQGKPTLVPESDKRPAMNTAITDFKDNGGK